MLFNDELKMLYDQRPSERDDSRRRAPSKLGSTEGSTGAVVNGQGSANVPRVVGGRVPTGVSLLTMPCGNGRTAIGAGGYYAPRTTHTPPPEDP